jgi:hypothetical protein
LRGFLGSVIGGHPTLPPDKPPAQMREISRASESLPPNVGFRRIWRPQATTATIAGTLVPVRSQEVSCTQIASPTTHPGISGPEVSNARSWPRVQHQQRP